MSQVQPILVPTEFSESLDQLVIDKLAQYNRESGKQLGYRPFRPTDFNTTFNINTRHYQTTGIAAAWTFLLNTATGLQVPTDSFYLIWGFRIIEDILPLSQQSRVQVHIDNVFKLEFCPKIVSNLDENCILLLDSLVEAKPDQLLEIRITNGVAVNTNAIIIPLGYRFVLKATADVT